MTHILQHDNSDASKEWYTPSYVLDAVKETFDGTIDLDPASCKMANLNVNASVFLGKKDNGLSYNWYGNIFLNPPYGKTGNRSNQSIWFRHLQEQYLARNVIQAISLHNASIGSGLFNYLLEFPVCFFHKRIAFYDIDGKVQKAPRYGNVAVYLGPNKQKFAKVFQSLGSIMTKVPQQ